MKSSKSRIRPLDKLKTIFIFGLVVLFACNQDNHTESVLMRYTSKSNGRQKIYNYRLETITLNEISTFNYTDIENEINYSLIFDSGKNSISIIENDIESSTIFLGTKNININERDINVKCYLFNNQDILGERQTIFFNKDYGLIFSDFTSGSNDYIRTTEKSDDVEKFLELIKNDTVLMNLDKKFIHQNLPNEIEYKNDK